MHHGWFNQRVVENTIKDLDSILLSCLCIYPQINQYCYLLIASFIVN